MESTQFLWLDKLVSVKITWKFLVAVFLGKFRQSSFVFYWPELIFLYKAQFCSWRESSGFFDYGCS